MDAEAGPKKEQFRLDKDREWNERFGSIKAINSIMRMDMLNLKERLKPY
jgi:hypothetical protein